MTRAPRTGRRTVTLIATAVMAVTLMLPATGAAQEQSEEQAQDGGPVVEQARQVTASTDPTRLFAIPEITVHPDDPERLALVAGDVRNPGCFVYTSQDGGLSWSSGVNVAPEETFCFQRNFGPASDIQWAADGTLLVTFSGSTVEEDHPNGPTTAYVARSDDGGQSFALTTVAEGQSDEEVTTPAGETGPAAIVHYLMNLEVDPTDPDVVYVGWKWRTRSTDLEDVPNKSFVAVSTDGGESFGEPVSLTDDFAPEGVENYFGSDTAMLGVDSQGVAHVVAQERPSDDDPAQLLYWQSTDQGETWTGTALDVAGDDLDSPDIAVDPSTDNIYVVLSQRTEPETEDRDGWLEPMFLASTDGGESWSEARNLSTDAAGFSAYFPGISVAPNGRVDVAWYDFRDDPFFDPAEAAAGDMGSAQDQRWMDVYATSSSDAGDSWSDNIRVTDRSIDTSVGVTFANSDIRGPVGIASTDAATFATWPDTRAANDQFEVEDAYMTRLRHAAPAASPAGSALLWAVLGAAAALVLAGIVLLVGTRLGRSSSPAPERERAHVG